MQMQEKENFSSMAWHDTEIPCKDNVCDLAIGRKQEYKVWWMRCPDSSVQVWAQAKHNNNYSEIKEAIKRAKEFF